MMQSSDQENLIIDVAHHLLFFVSIPKGGSFHSENHFDGDAFEIKVTSDLID